MDSLRIWPFFCYNIKRFPVWPIDDLLSWISWVQRKLAFLSFGNSTNHRLVGENWGNQGDWGPDNNREGHRGENPQETDLLVLVFVYSSAYKSCTGHELGDICTFEGSVVCGPGRGPFLFSYPIWGPPPSPPIPQAPIALCPLNLLILFLLTFLCVYVHRLLYDMMYAVVVVFIVHYS